MPAINYLDFDLQLDPLDLDAKRYRARVLKSPSGEAVADIAIPFSDIELENYILKMGRPRRGVRSLQTEEGRAAIEFGGTLFDAVFSDSVRACLASSLQATSAQGKGLRIRLRLNNTPELADLPWEYLYDPSLRRFFSHSIYTPIVRYPEVPQPTIPLAVTPPLNVLVMIASPRGYEALDVEAEWVRVQTALVDLTQRGQVTLTRLEFATLGALRTKLRSSAYHVFHFIGHGGFNVQTQEGMLVLADEQGQARLVSGQRLGIVLHDHRSLRLCLLNACEGARASQRDPFAGVAQHLVQQGIPAVIAMQFEITDRAAITLAQEFYSALADDCPVDGALAEARKAIYDENDVEWGTPVLYLRATNGHIFDVVESDTSSRLSLSNNQYVAKAHRERQWPALLRMLGIFTGLMIPLCLLVFYVTVHLVMGVSCPEYVKYQICPQSYRTAFVTGGTLGSLFIIIGGFSWWKFVGPKRLGSVIGMLIIFGGIFFFSTMHLFMSNTCPGYAEFAACPQRYRESLLIGGLVSILVFLVGIFGRYRAVRQ